MRLAMLKTLLLIESLAESADFFGVHDLVTYLKISHFRTITKQVTHLKLSRTERKVEGRMAVGADVTIGQAKYFFIEHNI